MLRDIPRIYLMFFLFILILVLLVVWYVNTFQRDGDTLQLNDAILTTAVAEVDQTSRLYEGALILADTFEPELWKRLEQSYGKGDTVQIDYVFDDKDTRFTGVKKGTVSSPSYVIGGSGADVPRANHVSHMLGQPIKAVRVKVHQKGDKVGEWTYQSTVTVDAASKAKK